MSRAAVERLIHGSGAGVVHGDDQGTWTLMVDREGRETWFHGMEPCELSAVPTDTRDEMRRSLP